MQATCTVAILAQGTTHGPMRSRRPFCCCCSIPCQWQLCCHWSMFPLCSLPRHQHFCLAIFASQTCSNNCSPTKDCISLLRPRLSTDRPFTESNPLASLDSLCGRQHQGQVWPQLSSPHTATKQKRDKRHRRKHIRTLGRSPLKNCTDDLDDQTWRELE